VTVRATMARAKMARAMATMDGKGVAMAMAATVNNDQANSKSTSHRCSGNSIMAQ